METPITAIRPIGTATTEAPSTSKTLTPGFAEALNGAASELCSMLSKVRLAENRNFVFFTPNLMASFSMLLAGAPDSVKPDLEAFLRTGMVQGDYHSSFKQWLGMISERSVAQASELAKTAKSADKFFYRQAQALLTREGATIPVDTATRLGAYNPVQISFQTDSQAKEFTNAWVEGQTDGKIKDLVEDLPEETVLVMVTAALFEGSWKYPFEPDLNSTEVFTNCDGSAVKITHMNLEIDGLRLFSDWKKGVTILELPYYGNTSMLIVQCGGNRWNPDGAKMAARLAEFMTPDSLAETLSLFDEKAYEADALDVGIPKINVQDKADLFKELASEPLVQKITSADWSGSLVDYDGGGAITTKQLVSEVQFQQDENGTAIAAASYSPSGCESCDPTFKIVGPFGTIIRDNSTNTILSMGQILKLDGEPATSDW